MHRRRRPRLLARAWQPRAGVEAVEQLARGHSLVNQPGVEHADEGRLALIDDQMPGDALLLGDVAVTIGGTTTDEVSVARFLQFAAAEPLAEQGAFILGNRPLDLQ